MCVDVDGCEFELDLTEGNQTDPFMELLCLVWKEYGETIKDNDLVPPWFKYLQTISSR